MLFVKRSHPSNFPKTDFYLHNQTNKFEVSLTASLTWIGRLGHPPRNASKNKDTQTDTPTLLLTDAIFYNRLVKPLESLNLSAFADISINTKIVQTGTNNT